VVLTFDFRSLEEIEDAGVDESMLAEAHVVTAARDQFPGRQG
jgi:hypothetical protein